MAEPLDTVVFQLSGDISPYDQKLAELEAKTDATQRRLSEKSAKFFSETQQGSARLMQLQRDLGGLQGATDTTGEKFTKLFQTVAAGVPALGGVATTAKTVTEEVTRTHGATSTATREFRALFDELSSGRTRMVPGTLAIIATRVFGISGAALAAGFAVVGVGAAFTAAAIAAENALGRVDRALKTTGFASGATLDNILRTATALDSSTGLSMRGGLDTLSILASHGNIGSAVLPGAATAAYGLSRATGLSEDKAAEELEQMLAKPAKAAEELNDKFKLFDAATTRQIKDLEESGQTAEAQKIIVDSLNTRFGHLEKSTNTVIATFDSLSKKASDFWFSLGTRVNVEMGGGSLQQQLAYHETAARDYRALGSPLAAQEQKIADDLRRQIAQQNAAAQAGQARAQATSAILGGMADVDKTDKFTQHIHELQLELDRDQLAVRKATETHSQFTDALIKQRDAVQTALNNQRTPAQIAAEEADDRRRVAAAPESQRATLEAQLAAKRELERNLSNPETAQYAQSIYKSQMGVAALNRTDTRDAAREAQNLNVMKEEAQSEIAVARAYEQGGAAVDKARALGEANIALARKEISNAKEYTQALLERAAAQDAVNSAQAIMNERQRNAGLDRLLAAGGNPLAIQRAGIENQALSATQSERDAAAASGNKSLIDLANTHLEQMRQELTLSAQRNSLIAANAEDYKLANENKLLELKNALMGQDQSLREKELADAQAAIDLTEKGVDITTEAGKAELAMRESLLEKQREQLDLERQLQQEQQKWVELSQEGVSMLGHVLDAANSGHTSLKKLLTDLGTEAARFIEKMGMLNPLQNALTKATTGNPGTLPTFGFSDIMNLFNGGGVKPVNVTPDVHGNYSAANDNSLSSIANMFASKGTPANPMYVIQMAGGSGSGSSGSGGFLSMLTGGSGSSGGFMSMFGGGGSDVSYAPGTSAADAPLPILPSAKGTAWGNGVRYAAQGMVLGGATLFGSPSGPVIGGELGANSEALMPLARGPDGNLGIRMHGAASGTPNIVINMPTTIHPDVSQVARGEIAKQMKTIRTNTTIAVQQALNRGMKAGRG